MKNLKRCEYNMDSGCVELRVLNGDMLCINCIAVENEYAENRYQRSELDYLIYNDPLAYADLIPNSDPEAYLKIVTDYRPMDNRSVISHGNMFL